MQLSTRGIGRAGALIAAAALAASCGDTTSVALKGAVQVTLWRTASPAIQNASPLISVGTDAEAGGSIDLTNVRCLLVEITGVHLSPVPPDNGDPNADPNEDAGWVRLGIEPVLVDLVNLPMEPMEGEDGQGFVIAFDPDVPAGDYRRLRFITGDNNSIYFREGFRVGQAEYQSNPDLEDPDGDPCQNGDPVKVPSGPQTGLKTDIALTVPDILDTEPREVELFFDESTTVRNAVATGSGQVNLTPVLRSRP